MGSCGFVRTLFVCALGVCVLGSADRLAAQTRTPRAYTSSLVLPRPTRDAAGHVVVSMEAQGDLRGLMTFELDPDANGTYSGKWALVVAYVQDVNPDGTAAVVVPHVEEPGHNDPEHHREYVKFVREGTVFGTISGATLHSGADGTIDGIEMAQLVVVNGSMHFESAKGYGVVSRAPVDPPVTTLTLNF